MSGPLREYFAHVDGFDAYPYGSNEIRNFLTFPYEVGSHDWVITNPPFRIAEDFVARALSVARKGVAILARTVFLESVGRYERVFRNAPPALFAQFCERVPMVKGRVDPKASTATGYGWFVWDLEAKEQATKVVWIPPCRRNLERDGDYQVSCLSKAAIPS
ncbi:hypothetical protein [Pararhodobacter sp. SW119]|uniref:hypothetical protein n=1 Tax=Pararhodobacter sp. SW119 TaxID=2780075 RepID=UPI001ADEF36A|nr:hypothetical protein [Pararhodobacter sp. SW119]